jgi:hypothetical protein
MSRLERALVIAVVIFFASFASKLSGSQGERAVPR